MTVPVLCPGCKSPLQVPDDSRGKQFRCSKCKTVFAVAATVVPSEKESGTPKPPLPLVQLHEGLQTAPGLVAARRPDSDVAGPPAASASSSPRRGKKATK